MIKFFGSQAGRGFLSSEGRGEKMIFVVGIPAGYMSSLRKLYRHDSNLIRIRLYRKNMKEPTSKSEPIEIDFDISKFIN